MKSILVVGLPKETAARLENSLVDVRVEAISRLDSVPLKLSEQEYSLLVLSEQCEGAGLIPVFRQVVLQRSGPCPAVICCLPRNLNSGAVGDLIHRSVFDEFLFHPLDPDDLVYRAARLLDVTVRPVTHKHSAQQQAAEAMASLWERFQPAATAHLEAIEQALLGLVEETISKEERAAVTHEAHLLAGCTESFGFAEAGRLAREIEQILATPGPVPPAHTQLLCLLIVVLRAELDSATASIGKAASAGSARERA